MITKGTNAQLAETSESAAEERPHAASAQRLGEGIGVFRGLLLTVLFYVASGFVLWFAWQLIQHARGQ